MRRYVSTGLAMIAMVSAVIAAGTPATSAAGPVGVSPGHMNGWYFWNDKDDTFTGSPGELVSGPGTPPAGTGSVRLGPLTDNGATAAGHSVIATNAYHLTALANITALSYSTYQPGPTLAIALQFDVRYRTTDLAYGGRLVFEPYQNGAVIVGSGWQSWSPLSGRWWASKTTAAGTGGAQVVPLPAGNCAISSPCTWSEINAAFPAAAVYGRFLLKAGSGWNGFDGNADNLTVGVSGADTTYDFEPDCSTVCYVRTDGDDANTGLADTAADAKKTIQAAVTQVSAGGTVHVAAGTYDENVTIGKSLTLAGASQTTTIVRPALSNPNCNAGGGGSLCGGGGPASNIILVQADNVTVHDLTFDGDNPALTSGIVQSGADLDARNGIITNHALGVYQNLVVHHATVKNIYLRGIYASSGGSFNFHHDTVQNVKGEFASIGMFNFGGAGTFADNSVSDTNDAIASNWSTGSTYSNNVVADSGSGVHSDNNGGFGGVADSLQGNTVSNCKIDGYGVWVFAPYAGPAVSQNKISGCAVGLAAAGDDGSSAVTTTFSDNEVDGTGATTSPGGTVTGVLVTTDRFGFGTTNVSAILTGNIIKNHAVGIDADAQAGYTTTINASRNAMFGNTAGVTLTNSPTPPVVLGIGAFNLTMTPNWWGSGTGPAHLLNPGGAGDSVPNGVIYSPWLGIGTDSSPSAGFQLTSPMTWIAGPAVCGATCIQAAIDFASNGDTVKAKTGVFPEHIAINKDITVTEGSLPVLDGGGSGDIVTITANGATLNGFEIRNGANGVVLTGVSGVTVSGNTIHSQRNVPGSAGVGIMAWGDNDTNTISGNTIHDNDRQGVFIGFCDFAGVGGACSPATPKSTGNTISGNTIYKNGQNTLPNGPDASQYGIQLWNADTNDIGTNTVYGHAGSGFGVGIYLCNSDSNDVHGNNAHDNQYNIAAFGCEEASTANNIHGNTLSAPADTNVRLFGGSPSSTVNANTMTDGKWGVKVSKGNTGTSVTNNGITKFLQQGVGLYGVTGALVDGNTIDGQGSGTTADPGTTPDTDTRYYGIFAVDSTGTLSNNVIKGIKHGLLNGTQSGVGIRLTARGGVTPGMSNMTISGNNISDAQKNAMVITDQYGGTSVNANVSNNIVAGNGPIAYIAQNGIQVSGGATATVSGNNVSGYDYTPNTAAAIGILLFGAGATSVTGNIVHDLMEGMYVQSTNTAIVTGNSFTNFRDAAIFVYLSNNGTYTTNTLMGKPGSTGMYVYDSSSNNSVTGNAFRNGDFGVIVDYTGAGTPASNQFNGNCLAGAIGAGVSTTGILVGPRVDATANWWGMVDGANPPGSGDSIIPGNASTIDATAFLTAPVAACPDPGDFDSDGLSDVSEVNSYGTDWKNPDTDTDGCGDGKEVGLSHSLGGDRDPLSPWDFFDVPTAALTVGNPSGTRSKAVTINDVIAIVFYVGTSDNGPANINGVDYDTDLNTNLVKDGREYDRTPSTTPGKPWRSGPPSGAVSISDAIVALNQVGDNCSL